MTVTAVNKVGLTTTAFSRPLLVDNTPPQVCVKTYISITVRNVVVVSLSTPCLLLLVDPSATFLHLFNTPN